MRFAELVQWQWEGYPRYHASRANVLIHLIAVPLFWAGAAGLAFAVVSLSAVAAIASFVALIASLAAQGRGHSGEAVPPEPFTGAGNAIARILTEQFVTFPRFVVSGTVWRRVHRPRVG